MNFKYSPGDFSSGFFISEQIDWFCFSRRLCGLNGFFLTVNTRNAFTNSAIALW